MRRAPGMHTPPHVASALRFALVAVALLGMAACGPAGGAAMAPAAPCGEVSVTIATSSTGREVAAPPAARPPSPTALPPAGTAMAHVGTLTTTTARDPYPTLSPSEWQTVVVYRSWHERNQGRNYQPTQSAANAPVSQGPPPNPPTNAKAAPGAATTSCASR
jgi:hypothetical protein